MTKIKVETILDDNIIVRYGLLAVTVIFISIIFCLCVIEVPTYIDVDILTIDNENHFLYTNEEIELSSKIIINSEVYNYNATPDGQGRYSISIQPQIRIYENYVFTKAKIVKESQKLMQILIQR